MSHPGSGDLYSSIYIQIRFASFCLSKRWGCSQPHDPPGIPGSSWDPCLPLSSPPSLVDILTIRTCWQNILWMDWNLICVLFNAVFLVGLQALPSLKFIPQAFPFTSTFWYCIPSKVLRNILLVLFPLWVTTGHYCSTLAYFDFRRGYVCVWDRVSLYNQVSLELVVPLEWSYTLCQLVPAL